MYQRKCSSNNNYRFKLLIYLFFLFIISVQSQTIQILDKKNKTISSVLVEIESVNQNSVEKNYGFSDKNGYINYKITPPFKVANLL